MSGQAAVPSPSPPPRRGHGCLWGCLIVLLILCIPVGVAGWFFWQGFRSDPALRAAVELVRRDGTAHRVLGDDIHITGVESRNFSYALGLYSESDYSVDLEGTAGQGSLEVRSHLDRAGVKIDSLYLTAPDGRRYDLMNHSVLPSRPGAIDNSI
jgi:Cytochrome oxidase complex assembly protein 1